LIEVPAEHREGWIAIIRSRHSERPECANSGRSPAAWPTGHIDPERAFMFSPGTEEMRQEPTFEKAMATQLLAIRQLSASGRAVSDADRLNASLDRPDKNCRQGWKRSHCPSFNPAAPFLD
jgi:hypothetical protein